MNVNNGWYSVFDTEHRPESGEEVLCLGMLDGSVEEGNYAGPLADQDNRVYYIATWFNDRDPMVEDALEADESLSIEEQIEQRVFGSQRPAPGDGFYIQETEIQRRKNTHGGRLPEYGMIYRYKRLHLTDKGGDGLIAWKPLDYPVTP